MKWPWVSRERYEELQGRLAAVEAERLELLRVVMRRATFGSAVIAEDPDPVPYQGETAKEKDERVPLANPFDHIESRFAEALKAKNVSARFRARV